VAAPKADARPTAEVCRQHQCLVAVQVSACRVTVDPDWLGIARGNHDVEIVWEIRNSPGVTFSRDEPVFFKSKELASKAFTNPKGEGGTRYSWHHVSTGPAVYHYGVRVVDNGRACPPLDPSIIDEM
jgi:hypothetical protein